MQPRVRPMLGEALPKEGELARESDIDFRAGKIPCCQMCHCPAAIDDESPSAKYTFLSEEPSRNGDQTRIARCIFWRSLNNGTKEWLKWIGI